jgi:cytochrome o ubiquinol oxidase subunit 2
MAWLCSSRKITVTTLLLPLSTLAGCEGVLDPRGPVGSAEKLILINSLIIMLAIIVPVIAATFGFAWWFRASNSRAIYRPTWAFSGSLELIVWAVPTLVIVFLGGIAWFGSHALDPYRPLASAERAVEVQVVALDWKWLFIYPEEGVASVNQLVVAAGRPIHFTLTSASVWNTFFVPQLGSMIYCMPGMTTQLNLQADRPGVFRGMSGMFSGDEFADMHFEVQALDEAGFETWVAGAQKSGAALDSSHYAILAQRAATAPVAIYRAADRGLFHAIVAGTAPQPAGAVTRTQKP